MAGCTAFTHCRTAAEIPHTNVRSMAVDFLRDLQTMVCTSLQACWYPSDRVRVVAWKPCIISWKASRRAFSSSVSAGSASSGASSPSGASGATVRLTARPVTAATGPVGHTGLVPVASSAPSSPLTISWFLSLFPLWSLSRTSSRSPLSSFLMVSRLYRGVWLHRVVDPVPLGNFR